jgi:hypothetical protein
VRSAQLRSAFTRYIYIPLEVGCYQMRHYWQLLAARHQASQES